MKTSIEIQVEKKAASLQASGQLQYKKLSTAGVFILSQKDVGW